MAAERVSVECYHCSGTGAVHHVRIFARDDKQPCHVCGGSGQVLVFPGTKPCARCSGSGYVILDPGFFKTTEYPYPRGEDLRNHTAGAAKGLPEPERCPACDGKGYPFAR